MQARLPQRLERAGREVVDEMAHIGFVGHRGEQGPKLPAAHRAGYRTDSDATAGGSPRIAVEKSTTRTRPGGVLLETDWAAFCTTLERLEYLG